MVTFFVGVLVGSLLGFMLAAIVSASHTEITEEDIKRWDEEQRAKAEKRRAKHERRKRLGQDIPANDR
jgi:hypothetical protein